MAINIIAYANNGQIPLIMVLYISQQAIFLPTMAKSL
jgi:hypothetical protein